MKVHILSMCKHISSDQTNLGNNTRFLKNIITYFTNWFETMYTLPAYERYVKVLLPPTPSRYLLSRY